jgi:hypothetical protein
MCHVRMWGARGCEDMKIWRGCEEHAEMRMRRGCEDVGMWVECYPCNKGWQGFHCETKMKCEDMKWVRRGCHVRMWVKCGCEDVRSTRMWGHEDMTRMWGARGNEDATRMWGCKDVSWMLPLQQRLAGIPLRGKDEMWGGRLIGVYKNNRFLNFEKYWNTSFLNIISVRRSMNIMGVIELLGWNLV